MKSHGNLLTSVSIFVERLCGFKKDAIGIGYLPLAHSLELCTVSKRRHFNQNLKKTSQIHHFLSVKLC